MGKIKQKKQKVIKESRIGIILEFLLLPILLLGDIGLFYIIPFVYMMYANIIISTIVTIMLKKRIFIIITSILVVMAILIPLMLVNSISFFIQVYQTIMPEGMNLQWSLYLPIYFWEVMGIILVIIIVLCLVSYAKFREDYDKTLMEGFCLLLITIWFCYTIVCLIGVGFVFNLVLQTNEIVLLIWDILFQYLPFVTMFFILYYIMRIILKR
jgi:hypothetical protein